MPTLAGAILEGEEEGSIYQRMDHPTKYTSGAESSEKLFSLQFIKKYLLYAKTTCEPVLTDEVPRKKKKNPMD